jgi:voltage-gated potassium channel
VERVQERGGGGRFQRWLFRKSLTPRRAAGAIAFATVVVTLGSGALMRLLDPHDFSNIWLGFWWGVQTVTTVGYGDVVPGQTGGRVIASILMLGGLSLLAVVTAVITSGFVTRAQAQMRADHGDPVMDKLEELSAQIERLQADRDGR